MELPYLHFLPHSALFFSSKLLSKCLVKLHFNLSTLKRKLPSANSCQGLVYFLRSRPKVQQIDWVNEMMNSNFERKVRFDFYRVSDVPHRQYRVRWHTCLSEITLGVLIGAGALNRANPIFGITLPGYLPVHIKINVKFTRLCFVYYSVAHAW